MNLRAIGQLLHSSSTDRLFAALASRGGNSRFVGGCVRDAILNKRPIDIDIATNLLPDQVRDALSAKHIKNLPIGIEHGTITAIIDNQQYEITTLREDVSTDGRRAVVKFTDDWKEDAQRRDFTINAMSYCPVDHKLHDYFDGLSDLEKGLIKFIGDPEQRIKEDHLRILRYFRFLGSYGKGGVEQVSLNACIKHKTYINLLSAERKCQEFTKILEFPNSLRIISLMYDSGVLQELVTNLRPQFLEVYQNLSILESAYGREINHLVKLFVLVNSDDGKSLIDFIKTLKLPNKQKKYLLSIQAVVPLIKEKGLLALVYENGKDVVLGALFFHLASMNISVNDDLAMINQLDDIVIKKLPISGKDIMNVLHIKQSARIGELLQIAQEHWLRSDCMASKHELLAMLDHFTNT